MERGFSINSDVIEHNMLERTVVAQRRVCDGVASMLQQKGITDPKAVQNITVSKELLHYCRVARGKYQNFLDEQKILKKTQAKSREKEEMRSFIGLEKKKLDSCVKNIESLRKEADELALKAERKNKLQFICESNEKRKRVSSLMEDADASRAKIRKLEDDLTSMRD